MPNVQTSRILFVLVISLAVLFLITTAHTAAGLIRQRDDCVFKYHTQCGMVRHGGTESYVPLDGKVSQ